MVKNEFFYVIKHINFASALLVNPDLILSTITKY
jgi:hypothetical protein